MPKLFKVSIILCFSLSVFLFYSGIAFAETETFTLQGEDIDKNKPVITVEIGGFSGWNDTAGWSKSAEYCPAGTKEGVECLQISWISDYIVAVYKYGVGVAAVLAVVMIMIGGFVWLMSGGNSTRVSTAKDFIVSAMAGLLLALFSFVILYAVNPRLINLEGVTSPLRPTTDTESDPEFYLISPTYENGDEAKIQDHCKRYCEVEYSSSDYRIEKDAAGWYSCYCGAPDIRNYIIKDKEIHASTQENAETTCEAYCFGIVEANVPFVTEANLVRQEGSYNIYNCSCYRVR
ncbi:MAG: hypothetical protein WC675_05570 [Patescibacteria group bacterium]|jgi:hypothetical protein